MGLAVGAVAIFPCAAGLCSFAVVLGETTQRKQKSTHIEEGRSACVAHADA